MKGLLFTYMLTYGGALVSQVRPYYGFLIYVCFGILKPESLWFWSVPAGNYSRIVALGLLLGWAIHGFGNWRLGKGKWIIIAMIGYWLVMLFGALTAPYPSLAWLRVEPLTKVLLPILVAATMIDSLAKVRQLAWVIVLSQGYLAFEFNQTYYNGGIIAWEWEHGGLDNNGIAMTMVTAIGLAFYLGLHADRWWHKLVAFGCAVLMIHVVLFSNSRGGMLALLVTGAICFVLTPKRPRDYLFLLVALAVTYRLAGENVQKRFMTTFAEKGEVEGADGGGGRKEQWKACLSSMVKRPLGVGPNHWPLVAEAEYGLHHGQVAHSTWMETGAEVGLPGLLCLLGMYLICVVKLWPLARERTPVEDPWIRYLARMVIAGLVGFLVAAQFVTVYAVELPYYLALIGVGTLKLRSWAEDAEREANDEPEAPACDESEVASSVEASR